MVLVELFVFAKLPFLPISLVLEVLSGVFWLKMTLCMCGENHVGHDRSCWCFGWEGVGVVAGGKVLVGNGCKLIEV